MKKNALIICLAVGTLISLSSDAQAQLRGRLGGRAIYNGPDTEGLTITNDVGFVLPQNSVRMARKNKFSPARIYTYSNRGIDAGLTHQWNQQQAQSRNWHGNYSHWRYGEPTALVVPPTAAYQTSYGWGVGQVQTSRFTTSIGRAGAGTTGGGDGSLFSRTPYWPSHTDQFGVYSVRAPW